MRPCKEESVNWDTTQNLYIEGDNLEVLKILRDAYFKKIKLIYIDPPYNTGKDFIYKDNYAKNEKEHLRETNQVDDNGNRLVQNKETNGRFHTDWLNMMYPRLKLARDLLTDDGVIFISIDDHEVHNLRKSCDEVFGEENFVAQICHKHRDGVSNDKIISSNHNFLLFYCKNINVINDMRNKFGIKRSEIDFKNYNKDDNDGKGLYALNPVTGPGGARKGNPYYEFLGINNYWRFSKERMIKMWKERIIVKLNNNLYQKTYKNDIINTKKNITTWWDTVGTTAKGTKQIKNLFGTICFDFAKPIELVKHILKFIHYQRSDIILDFFSGSATTAHAVMQLNAEDGGNRKFVMVQFPEPCNANSEAFKEGYKNICEIGKERIRKAGKKIIEETGKTDLDVGFRVLKLDSSNMKKTHYLPKEYNLSLIKNNKLYENIKEDRTPEDLLIQSMLKIGIFLSSPIKEEFLENKRFFNVNNDELICYFDDNLTDDLVEKILDKHKNLKYFVTRDSAVDDNTLINVDPLVKIYNPNLKWEVI